VIQINIPALRKPTDDIGPLVNFFKQKHQSSASPKVFTPETIKILRAYDWPGYVRELENAVQRAIILSQGEKYFLIPSPLRYSNQATSVHCRSKIFLRKNLPIS